MDYHGAAGGQRGGDFPGGHQEGEVPRNDLADHADGLAQHNGNVFIINFVHAALFGQNHAGKVAEMLGAQRNIGGAGFADGLAVVEGFLQGQLFSMRFNHIGDFVQNGAALIHGGVAPGFQGFLRGGHGSIHIFVARIDKSGQRLIVGRII